MRSWLASAIVISLLATSGSARAGADDAAEAEKLIAKGVSLREAGKDDEALVVFKKALDKSATPRARAQVGLAEQALGMWVSAESDLVLALAVDSDPWIAKNKGALEGALAVIRRHVGSLDVRGPEGAEVFLDGVRLGTLPPPTPFRVEAGRRALEVRAKGFHATERTIEIPPNGVARETVRLEALPAEGSGSSGGTSSGGSRKPGGDTAVNDGSGQRLLGWIFVGTGATLAVGGGIALLVRQGKVDDYNNSCPGLGVAQPAGCDAKADSSRSWTTITLVTLIAGGAFLGGGAAIVLTAPKDETPHVACAPTFSTVGAGASCAATF